MKPYSIQKQSSDSVHFHLYFYLPVEIMVTSVVDSDSHWRDTEDLVL